ncbi:MAG: nucleotidyltransferase family protein [Hyphomonadaceae bacterium]
MTALLDTVLETIRARRDEIEARYGIRLLGVVGSVARGEERSDSDVDITYQVPRRTTLFRVAAALNELEDDLGRRVDLVDTSAMRARARAYIEKDLVRA